MRNNSYALLSLFLFLGSEPTSIRSAESFDFQTQTMPIAPAFHLVDFSKLPLAFEPNVGQAGSEIAFVAHQGTAVLGFSSTGVRVSVPKKGATRGNQTRSSTMDLHFLGAAKVPGVAEKKLPGIANYFIGNTTSRWKTNIPTYGRIVFKNIYPGIHVAFHGEKGTPEYDFIVEPGANLNLIQVSFDGPEPEKLAMAMYEETPHGHKPVAGNAFWSGNQKKNHLGFAAAGWSGQHRLVIDPVLNYSTYLGGSSDDQALGIAVDTAGNAFVVGYASSTNFPVSTAYQSSFAGGNQDVFIAKLSANGKTLLYATYLGGTGDDIGERIKVDALGSAYVVGFTTSTDFPVSNAYKATNSGGTNDAFVTKLSPSGTALVYSTYLGGNGRDAASGLAVDTLGCAYVAGNTNSTNFPVVNAYQAVSGGSYDAFVTKFSATGSSIIYSTYLGGSSGEVADALDVDSLGSAYVVGQTFSTNFPVSSPYQSNLNGSSDAFVTKLSPDGSALVYSTYLGGNGSDEAYGIVVDTFENAYVAGQTTSGNFPVANAHQSSSGGGAYDSFVAKLNPNGSSLSYSTYLGGSGIDSVRAIAVDTLGSVSVAGFTDSSNFPILNASQSSRGGGTYDAFVTKFSAGGDTLVYSTYLGGSGTDMASGIAVDATDGVYLAGNTDSTNFQVANAYQATSHGSSDAFISKFNESGSDAGISPVDAGTAPDSGTLSLDGGTGPDSGTNFVDAGIAEDAGMVPLDAGTDDAGTATVPDSGVALGDAGTAADGGSNDPTILRSASCGCGNGSTAPHGLLALLLLLGVAFHSRRAKPTCATRESAPNQEG